ncbi:type I restriction enzyme M protein [Amycolatopsis tolypomycina]|uniref:Type I restriction enzyme M protein n=1 Tax=Amycolatopsis tolypomycina TaxID=208445 RepID=A0A1H4JIT7_9PSEU|nr:N-6 DNA methylase [Amycolatopsis tolypomycina]SEB45786.1 type I restriction enzyme M protein [Amycolatopsis tolypomycina]
MYRQVNSKVKTLSTPQSFAAPVTIGTTSVPDGKVSDFLTGRLFKDTPEEYVRQNVEKALIRGYRYTPRDCAPEFPIKVGSSRRRVDIVVFAPGLEHAQENAWLLVETKKRGTSASNKTEGVEQLKSYMAACLNVQYGMWTNGDEQLFYAKRQSARGFKIEEIIEIPAAGQTEADAQRPKRKDLKPATADNLLFAFRRCHNYIAGTEGKQKSDAFWELLKLIFCKIEDERSKVLDFYATAAERNSATAAIAAKKRIQKVFIDKVVNKYPAIFPGSDREIDLKPAVVAFVATQLQGFSLLASPVDVKGVAYEEVVGSNLRGDRGEFFTPRNACRMAVTMLNPQPDERLIDPACGTGGFLITAMNAALDHIEAEERAEWVDPANGTDAERQQLWTRRNEYLSRCVHGADLNPGLVRAAKMNMVMNNDGSGGLFQANSLANPHLWDPKATDAIRLGSFDVVVSNPPFGANILIDDEEVLRQYDLAAMWDRDEAGGWKLRKDSSGQAVLQKSQPPEILFIERCVQLLRPGTGRMAMVIPNGILNNPALGYVRHWIMTNTQVLAVVDMSRELFQPKNDTQTSMVLLRRLSDDERQQAENGALDYPIFMAVTRSIGHDKRGNVTFRRTETGEDVVVKRIDTIAEIDPESGNEVLRQVETEERLIDDELPDVAREYLHWLGEQS